MAFFGEVGFFFGDAAFFFDADFFAGLAGAEAGATVVPDAVAGAAAAAFGFLAFAALGFFGEAPLLFLATFFIVFFVVFETFGFLVTAFLTAFCSPSRNDPAAPTPLVCFKAPDITPRFND